MRKLKLVVRSTTGALPVIIAASVVPATSCGSAEGDSDKAKSGPGDASAGQGGAGGQAGVGGQGGQGGTGGVITVDSGGGAGGTVIVPDAGEMCQFGIDESFDVELPPEGTPAEPGQICAAAVEPVESGRAARVTLSGFSSGGTSADGLIEVDPALFDRIVGDPIIEVIDSTNAQVGAMTTSGVTREATGFSFQAAWPNQLFLPPDGMTRMTIRVSLELSCGDGGTRVLHAVTDLHLCDDNNFGVEWVSSGDRCVVCQVIAEMAPSPIVPDKSDDELPLARALRLRIVELARVSNTIVLLAENDGGEGLEYEWHPSVGKVEKLSPDVIAWTVEDGMPAPMIQAAVVGPAEAAVASFAFNEEAA